MAIAKSAIVKKPLTSAEIIAGSKPSDWRILDPENVLYMDLPGGRIIIELAPNFAPQHVANIKKLAREKYWDGLAIIRVQDNYVVQWADPNSEDQQKKRKLKEAKETLGPEFERAIDSKMSFKALPDKDVYAPVVGFSDGFAVARDPQKKKTWMTHCYGVVGVGRDVAVDSGGGTELYAVIGHAPRQLDRNITLVGRVLQGMELFSSLPRGHGPLGFYEKTETNTPIRSIRLEADVPEKERTQLEVLKTDTPLFDQYISARRNRTEEWFHFKAGHIDVCNLTIPVREKK